MSIDMQPSAGEGTHWARVVAGSSFPSSISNQFMSAMSIQMAVINNRKMHLEEEAKLKAEAAGKSEKPQHDRRTNQKKDNKAKLAKLLAVRKVRGKNYSLGIRSKMLGIRP